ncbi:MAG: ATP-binding protein [Chloroflexales bacterium]
MAMVRRLWKGLNSQLRYQIIFPFLLLTFMVAAVGSFVVFFLLGQRLQESFDTDLTNLTRSVSDDLSRREASNLQFLRQATFAAASNEPLGGAIPSVADALAGEDIDGLTKAITRLFNTTKNTSSLHIDRLIVFDKTQRSVIDFEWRSENDHASFSSYPSLDLQGLPFTRSILDAKSDGQGDKYAGLIRFSDTNTLYFATFAPIYRSSNRPVSDPNIDVVIGGMIVAVPVDQLLIDIKNPLNLDGLTLYKSDNGEVLGTTFSDRTAVMPMDEFLVTDVMRSATETATATISTTASISDTATAPISTTASISDTATTPISATAPISDTRYTKLIFKINSIDNEAYQFAYVPLRIRGAILGILAPARSRTHMTATWNSTVWPVMGLVVSLALTILIAGFFIARHITMPLEELARASIAIAEGKLDQRARIAAQNEIGQLAVSFNQMTGFLVRLYDQVQAEASQRAAIVESIADGIVVVDDQGNVQTINRATRRLMHLAETAPPPAKLSDIPMQKVAEGGTSFGTQRTQDLYALGEHIVRVSIAPVVGADGMRSGYVCLLQDMTAEVAMDRAKTNFIGTISHELRTPLTVISGNADLLLRGLAGRLEGEQPSFVETIRQHSNNMASLLQNVIIVANLDSGSTSTDLEALELLRPVEEANWRVQSQIKAKGLTLTLQIPKGLRPVWADFDHVRQVVYQLLDNARRYTQQGSITVRALDCGTHVRVEVQDTGRGIPPDMQKQIFERFIRGDGTSEGINSAERGIGLGLAICKQLVERLGGIIEVTSIPGEGSTFAFTLRYANDPSSPENETSLATAA